MDIFKDQRFWKWTCILVHRTSSKGFTSTPQHSIVKRRCAKSTTMPCLVSGFTLIELLIYLAIISGFMVSIVLFSISISNARAKTFVVQEVHENGRLALIIISQKIRAAIGINNGASVFGSDPGVLSLSMTEVSVDPTVIDLTLNDGILQITEGASPPIAITSDKVKVTNLVFTDLTGAAQRKHIRLLLTVEYADTSGDPIYKYSKSWQTAVSLRQ